jgi:NADPH:quinone reductase-like Zn-dependent oxidoreductase
MRVGFAIGDRVWCTSLGHADRLGSFATYVVMSAERLYPLPDGVDAI